MKEKIDLRGFNGREMFQQMIKNVRNRRGYLAAQREELEKELSRLRCGRLRVANTTKGPRYYAKSINTAQGLDVGQDDPGSGWTYLKKEDLDIARELARGSLSGRMLRNRIKHSALRISAFNEAFYACGSELTGSLPDTDRYRKVKHYNTECYALQTVKSSSAFKIK